MIRAEINKTNEETLKKILRRYKTTSELFYATQWGHIKIYALVNLYILLVICNKK